jgi:transposase
VRRDRHAKRAAGSFNDFLERKPFRVVAVAVANKMARVAWALLARGVAM